MPWSHWMATTTAYAMTRALLSFSRITPRVALPAIPLLCPFSKSGTSPRQSRCTPSFTTACETWSSWPASTGKQPRGRIQTSPYVGVWPDPVSLRSRCHQHLFQDHQQPEVVFSGIPPLYLALSEHSLPPPAGPEFVSDMACYCTKTQSHFFTRQGCLAP